MQYSGQPQEDWNGVSIEGIDKLMTDILDYADKTNKIFNQISDLVDSTQSCFACDAGDQFREQYHFIQIHQSTINSNILSYNTDLMHVKTNYLGRERGATEIIGTHEEKQ